MKYYKLINSNHYGLPELSRDRIYKETDSIGPVTVEMLACNYPKDWIEVNPSKAIGWNPKESNSREANAAMIMAYGKKWVDEHVKNIVTLGYMFSNAINRDSLCYKLKEAGVLDLWFEPVFDKEKMAPRIVRNGYMAKFEGNKISFGTDSFEKTIFLELHKAFKRYPGIDSVKIGDITFRSSDIEEIAQYYEK